MVSRKVQRKINEARARLTRAYLSLYPKATEIKLIEIMGGKTLTLDFIVSRKNGRPLTLILSRGSTLRREHFRRTGDSLILFSNDLKWALALQGRDYERDVVAAYERDTELRAEGWHIMYIPVNWLRDDPAKVRHAVTGFLAT